MLVTSVHQHFFQSKYRRFKESLKRLHSNWRQSVKIWARFWSDSSLVCPLCRVYACFSYSRMDSGRNIPSASYTETSTASHKNTVHLQCNPHCAYRHTMGTSSCTYSACVRCKTRLHEYTVRNFWTLCPSGTRNYAYVCT